MKKPEWIKDIKVLAWDLDKTLYKNTLKLQEEIRRNIYLQVAEQKGWSFNKAKQEFIARHKKNKASTKVLYSLNLDGIKTFEKIFDAIDWSKFLKKDKELKKIFLRLKDFQHVLITNNMEKFANLKLRLLGLDKKVFDYFFCLHSLGLYKPDPRAFELVLEKTGLSPDQHLSIGDKESTDIGPAKKIGMRTCLVWGESKIADISLKTVYDVEELIVNC